MNSYDCTSTLCFPDRAWIDFQLINLDRGVFVSSFSIVDDLVLPPSKRGSPLSSAFATRVDVLLMSLTPSLLEFGPSRQDVAILQHHVHDTHITSRWTRLLTTIIETRKQGDGLCTKQQGLQVLPIPPPACRCCLTFRPLSFLSPVPDEAALDIPVVSEESECALVVTGAYDRRLRLWDVAAAAAAAAGGRAKMLGTLSSKVCTCGELSFWPNILTRIREMVSAACLVG